MYYEVYVDVLFVENFCINMMLLFLTAWADQSEVHKFRMVIAAAIGSAGACLLTIFSAGLSSSSWLLCSV
ncbi:MAG: sigma-E processing peptidase SpoIIGA, partial [Lachnospiraceae bacterium]|nr:sigma-E processing peptidase SpoIIGA [Lachnospiraceae bacterium]